MKRVMSMITMLSCSIACAEDDGAFTPPQVYAVERYEAGWSKNPFTLKTAPVAVENAPFARDLAVGTYYGDAADPTIVIVNTKTNERIPLKKGQPAANGMKLNDVKFGSSRKDIVAQVTLGVETSEIRYNDSYLKQMAAAEAPKAPAIQQQLQQQQLRQQGAPPIRVPMPQPPVQPGKAPPPGTAPATAGVGASPLPPGQAPSSALAQGGVSPSGAVDLTVTPAINATGNRVNLTVSNGAQPGGMPAASLISQATNPNATPVPVRRRLITPVVNASAIPQ